MKFSMAIALVLSLAIRGSCGAGVIGNMTPAQPVTMARVPAAPKGEQAAWAAYIERSKAAHERDVETLLAEQAGGPPPPPPLGGDGVRTMSLAREPAWYAGEEARRIADIIVSFQTPSGGWGKNMSRAGSVRVRGQAFTPNPSFVGTFDNDATVTELRFLARVIANLPAGASDPYRRSFDKGLVYVFQAQYPNGGWPQIYPLQGDYHDAVTFNDGVMLAVTRLLGEVAHGTGDYGFASPAQRAQAKTAWAAAMACILRTQVTKNGAPTGWSQQYDAFGLTPVGARNYEMASLSSSESAEILLYLMSLPTPGQEVRAAIEGGARWMAVSALQDKSWTPADPVEGRRLVDRSGANPLWARYYDLASNKPIFGDRDRTIHDDVNDLSLERRNGYAWFTTSGSEVAAAYTAWKAKP